MDPSQVDQILANLCINARDAMDGEGRLTIETEPFVLDQDEISSFPEAVAGEYVRLSITDTGSGMTPEVYEKIFEPFFTTKEPGKGTGLGLATVFGAVRQNGGFIEVETAPGEGSVFRIHLPRCGENQPADSPSAVLAMEGGRPATILLVEDASAVMAVARLSLERRQHRILAATDPLEALRIAQEHPDGIDLLLTDVVMPGMGGRELARRIRQFRPGIRVLFMTGYSREVLGGLEPLEEGMGVLPKPFTADSLAAKVAESLGT
jgi:CheY-like chemotaxis protein